ncbi:MAG TPA: ABC transporter permease, partial [Firmicutes bacterium]|nr:ABC transporter permease [Bacillota bacterium]
FGSYYTSNILLSVIAAMLTGGLMALILAYVSINHKANQVVVGTAINMLSVGLLGYLLLELWNQAGRSPMVAKVKPLNFPFLKSVPFLGDVLNGLDIFVYLALLLVPLAHIVLFKTKFGLRVRAVGEHPMAAETAGINVNAVRYVCVVLSGVLAGIGGAYLSIGELGMFTNQMTAGRGFIAMAAMIFGKWSPGKAFAACLMFGAAEALQMAGQVLGWPIPKDVLIAFPYILTIVVLAGFVGRAVAPAALGKPYPE